MIHPAMWTKAHSLIAADARDAWLKANTSPSGKRYKRHRGYTISERAVAMCKAMARGDAEAVSALILNWEYPAAVLGA